MKRWHAWLLALGLAMAGMARGEPEALTVGVVPYLTANVLIGLFQPLRQHLEKEMGRPVDLYTAPDVRTFVKRTQSADFDLVITAAHHARLAQLDSGYRPLGRFSGPLHALVVVPAQSRARDLADLRGRKVAITDRSILVNIATLKALADRGLGEKDLAFTPANSQNAALLALSRGAADAAIVAHFTLNQIPAEQQAGLRVLYKSGVLPNVVMLSRPGLDPAQESRLRQALLHFPATEAGRAFLEKSRFGGLDGANEAYMRSIDTYLPETRRQLFP